MQFLLMSGIKLFLDDIHLVILDKRIIDDKADKNNE